VEKESGVLDEIMDAADAADPFVGAACDAYTDGKFGGPDPDDPNLSHSSGSRRRTCSTE
jgi:hypothetical protein